MDEVTDKLTRYLEGIEQRLGRAEELVVSEVPQFVSELLTFHWWQYLALTLFWLLVLAGALKFTWHAGKAIGINHESLKPEEENDSDDIRKQYSDTVYLGSSLVLLVIFGVGLYSAVHCAASIGSNALQLLKISTAPRVYVVDYLREELRR